MNITQEGEEEYKARRRVLIPTSETGMKMLQEAIEREVKRLGLKIEHEHKDRTNRVDGE